MKKFLYERVHHLKIILKGTWKVQREDSHQRRNSTV